MKNLYKSLFVAALLIAPTFVACEDDNDDNPTLTVPTSFVLNTPANANMVYDLLNSQYLTLTTSQPNYGYTAPVTYTVMVKAFGADYVALGTTYTTTKIQIPAKELNTALLDMAGEADLSAPVPVTFKLSANITGYTGDDMIIESNEVSVNLVQCYVPEVSIELPKAIYFVGDCPASNWDFVPLNPVYGKEGQFYGIVYIENEKKFRFSLDAGWKGNYIGWSNCTREGSAGEALADANNDDNMLTQSDAGLYSILIVAKIANGAIQYTFTMQPASIYVIGAAAGGEWSMSPDYKMTDNHDGTATITLGGDGELRLGVDVGTDWWRTEFTIMNDGSLFYRNCDIPNNWAENLGADYSFQAKSGSVLTLDFTTKAGSGKME